MRMRDRATFVETRSVWSEVHREPEKYKVNNREEQRHENIEEDTRMESRNENWKD